MKLPDFLHVDTNSPKLKKWVWPVWSQDSIIDCISRTNRWNELILRAGANSVIFG